MNTKILIVCLFFCFYNHAQVSMQSASEPNDSEKNDLIHLYVERPKVVNHTSYLDLHTKYDNYLQQIIGSGKIVYDDEYLVELQSVVNGLSKNAGKEYKVRIVRTNQTVTFSNQNELFISTGLIAQVTTLDQLCFFIFREIERSKRQLYHDYVKVDFDRNSFENKIRFLGYNNFSNSLLLDSLALSRISSSEYSAQQIDRCIDILAFSFLPYQEIAVPVTYLQTPDYYIPPSFFDVYGETGMLKNENPYNIDHVDSNMIKRKNRLVELNQGASNNKNATSLDKLVSLKEFSHHEYLIQHIINCDFLEAVYALFLYEHNYGKNEKSDVLKAHVWHGFSLQKTGLVDRKATAPYHKFQSESARFLTALRKLNINGVGSIALRTLFDLHSKYPNNSEIALIWLNLRRELVESPFFQIDKFSHLSYFEVAGKAIDQLKADSLANKYDKIESAYNSGKAHKFDSTEFYFYGIPDLISDSTLFIFDESADFEIRPSDKLIIIPFITKNEKYNYSLVKSNALLNEVKSETQSIIQNNPAEIRSPYDLTTTELISIKDLFSNLYASNKYTRTIIPYNCSEIKELGRNGDYLVIAFHESAFKPKLKGFHFVGLFVAPLPFIVPDLINTSFQNYLTIAIIDCKTGVVKKINYVPYFEPSNEKTITNRIYQSVYGSN